MENEDRVSVKINPVCIFLFRDGTASLWILGQLGLLTSPKEPSSPFLKVSGMYLFTPSTSDTSNQQSQI